MKLRLMSQKSQYAYVNRKMLKWAREQAGLSLEEAAGNQQKAIKLEKVEKGEAYFTFPQLIEIANRFKRPIGFFYLNNPPLEEFELEDFRTIESKKIAFPPKLREQIIKINEKRDFLIEFPEYNLNYDYSWVKSVSLENNIEIAAKKIEKILELQNVDRKKWRTEYDALNGWRAIIELKGVLIFQISGISIENMRGFSISKVPFPVIALNTQDAPLGRIFTMLHEFCHIMLNKGGICKFSIDQNEHNQIEQYCNAVAGVILVPILELLKSDIVQNHSTSEPWNEDELKELSRYFWVSKEVILRRLLDNGLTDKQFYQERRHYWNSLESSKKGGPVPIETKVLSRNPRSFIKSVLDAMYDEKITMSDVSYYLDMSLKHLSKLEKKIEG